MMERMTTGKFRHVPVVEQEQVIGIVSIGDVVKHRLQEIEQRIRRAARLHPDGLNGATSVDRRRTPSARSARRGSSAHSAAVLRAAAGRAIANTLSTTA